MIFIRLLPAITSLLLLSAHFSRANLMLLSLIFLLAPLLLFIKKRWIARFMKILLIIGTLEWIRSLLYYVYERQLMGEPYIRLIIIIGSVAIITGLSPLVFKNIRIKHYFNIRQ